MTIPGIIRYIKNNEMPSVSKYILSSYYPPSVPFKCHLWSVPLFVSKKTFSLFFFKVVESLCWTKASHSKIKVLKTFILKSPSGAHQISEKNILFSEFSMCFWKCQMCSHLNNVTSHKETSDEHRIQLLKVWQKKVQEVPPPTPKSIINNSHELLYMWTPTECDLITECDFLSLSFSLQMEALKTHFNRRNTWYFHLKGKNKALHLLSYVLLVQNV